MNVCVFCSSRMSPSDGDFAASIFTQGKAFCRKLVDRNFGFVYGGGACGLMGYLADQIVALGGKSLGVLPEKAFKKEVAHPNLTKLIYTKDLLDRKRILMENSQAFVIFPGGIGTMDEALEVITWKTIYGFQKPILFFNWQGFWNPFLDMLKNYEKAQLFDKVTMESFQVVDGLDDLFRELDRVE